MQVEELILSDHPAGLTSGLVVVEQAVEVGPFFNLPPPLWQGGQGGQHQERPKHPLVGVKMIEESDGLDGLAQSHLVSQY